MEMKTKSFPCCFPVVCLYSVQTLGTHGGIDMEYFKTGDQHYLAVANFQNRNSS